MRAFTPDEDARLLAMEAEGVKRSVMARRLGRKPNSVRGRLMVLARHEARREAAEALAAANGVRVADGAGPGACVKGVERC